MAVMRRGVLLPLRAGVGGGAWWAHVGRRAMVRRGAVTRWPATSQNGATALVAAAWRCHKATVELLVDRGADLEAKAVVRRARVLPSGRIVSRASRAGRGPRWRWGRCHGVLAAAGWLSGMRRRSHAARRMRLLTARGLAGWLHGADDGGLAWPQGHGGAAAGPGCRPGGQRPREWGGCVIAARRAAPGATGWLGKEAVMAMMCRGVVVLWRTGV